MAQPVPTCQGPTPAWAPTRRREPSPQSLKYATFVAAVTFLVSLPDRLANATRPEA